MLRNLWHVVRHFKAAFILNLLGLAVCFIIGAPLTWMAVDRWLESFAYRTPLHWWVFPAAFAAVAAVTLLTVIGQSWRAANENPVKNLKSE